MKHSVLDDISFAAMLGQTIGIMGPTGTGKATVVNLLSCFYDIKSGSITIDGHDMHSVTLNSLRTQMGVMLQNTFLFTGTIADNIRYGKIRRNRRRNHPGGKDRLRTASPPSKTATVFYTLQAKTSPKP